MYMLNKHAAVMRHVCIYSTLLILELCPILNIPTLVEIMDAVYTVYTDFAVITIIGQGF